jgi:hypothetical protein
LCLRELPAAATPAAAAAELSEQQPAVQSSPRAGKPGLPASGAPDSLATLALWITLAVVGLGVLFIAPGLAILLAIAVTPALLRTVLMVGRLSQRGEQISTSRKAFLFLGSLATSVIVAIVVLVAAVGSFCAVCLSAGKDSAIPLAALFSVVVTGGVVFLLWKWIRHRWQRDVNRG